MAGKKKSPTDDPLRTGGALEGPLGREVLAELTASGASLVGRTLAHYRVVDKIAQGGMGEVYVADDGKLHRKVALKVLPPTLAEDEERRLRFEREAQAIAALNHPNIVTVYSVEEVESIHFITMELVSGKTLKALQPRKGFLLDPFFELAIPLADAVATAHREGITHRDLKPDNVMVNDEGRVKVLDFGLAKEPPRTLADDAGPTKPTLTRDGTVVGTPEYMSPEQARGESVDTRSDIFSLGIMLHEMLTGSRPFTGNTPEEIRTSIVTDTPSTGRGIPRELFRLLQRCLAKKPSRRVQNAFDIRNELEQLRSEMGSGDLAAEATSPANKTWLAALVALAMVSTAVLVSWFRATSDVTLSLVNPTQVTSAGGAEDFPSWSPDGSRLAYESNQSGNWDVWISQTGGGEAVNLTEEHVGDDRYPSWSPDGRHIAFLSRRTGAWYLYTMLAVGGSPRKLTSPLAVRSDPLGPPQWSAGSDAIAVPIFDSPLTYAEIVDLTTERTRRVLLPQPGGDTCYHVSWSPDGRWFAYIDAFDVTANITRVWIAPASGGPPIPVTERSANQWNPSWSADSRTLFYVSNRGGAMDLWRQPIDEDGQPEGEPRPITAGLGIRSAAFSPDGDKLAYSRGPRLSGNVWRVPVLRERRATWADAEQITFDRARIESLDVSPDGKHLVFNSNRTGNPDLWILSLENGQMTQLTTHPAADWWPTWSPDGEEIAFYAYRSGNRDIWVVSSSGGRARQLTFDPTDDTIPAWSPDSRAIAFASWRSGNQDIWIVDANGGEPRRVTVNEARDTMPTWTRDASSLLFASTRSGSPRLWRIPASGGAAEISSQGAAFVSRMSPDGRTLYFQGPEERAGNVWALSLEDGNERPVTDLTERQGTLGYGLAVDGTYLYFSWWEDVGDIWVMNVVHE